MTVEAWVRPTVLNDWQTVVMKEQLGGLTYGLYSNTNNNRPSAHAHTTREFDARGTNSLAVNTWTHVAATYDGTALRIFVNGVQASSLNLTGPMVTSTGALRIGGNSLPSEWFAGLIDEVRVYSQGADRRPDPAGHERAGQARAHRHPGAHRSRARSRPPAASARPSWPGRRPRTTWAWPATTSIAAPPPGSRPRRPTAWLRSRARATPTPAAPRAPTTTASPRRTPRATWARSRRRPPPWSRPTRPRPTCPSPRRPTARP